jgi:hypothetical protein
MAARQPLTVRPLAYQSFGEGQREIELPDTRRAANQQRMRQPCSFRDSSAKLWLMPRQAHLLE